MTTKQTALDTRDQLKSGLKMVIDEAQRLLSKADDRATDNISYAKDRLSSKLQTAQTGLYDAQEETIAAARDAAVATGRYVKENPWKAVAAGAVAGIIVGVILGRK